MDSLGFAENIAEKKWRDDSTDALISDVHSLCISKMRTPFGPFWPVLISCMVSADYWLADYPELRQTIQPSTIGSPLGEPGFCIFCSTETEKSKVAVSQPFWKKHLGKSIGFCPWPQLWQTTLHIVLRIRGRPVAKWDPLLSWAIQHDPTEVLISGNTIQQRTHANSV